MSLHWFWASVILVTAATLRLFHLDSLPNGLSGDEAMNALDALGTLERGMPSVFYEDNNGREGLFVWLQAISHAFLEPTVTTARLPAALIGIVTVAVSWPMARDLIAFLRGPSARDPLPPAFAAVVPVAVALFLATSLWHVAISRFAVRAVLDPFFAALSVWLVCRLLSGPRSLITSVLTGLGIGLGLYGYVSAKAMALPLGMLFLYALLDRRPYVVEKGAIVATIVAGVVAPLATVALTAPETYFGRAAEVSVFAPALQPYLDDGPWAMLRHNLVSVITMWAGLGDLNPRHNIGAAPALSPLVLVAALVGIVAIVRRTRDYLCGTAYGTDAAQARFMARLGLLLSTWFLVMTVPMVLTFGNGPHMLRGVGMLLPVLIAAGVGAAVCLSALTEMARDGRVIARTIGAVALLVLPYQAVVDVYLRPLTVIEGRFFPAEPTETAEAVIADGDRHPKLVLVRPDPEHPSARYRNAPLRYLLADEPWRYGLESLPIDNVSAADIHDGLWLIVPREADIEPILQGAAPARVLRY